jgi:signal transduction histidine kinase
MMTAINRLLMDFTSRTRTQARLKLVGEDRPLPPVTEIALFRITQEAVRNIERHAQATDMAVTITFGADEIRLDVTDNGVGFVIPSNTGDLATGGHLGLISMQERTKLLGGKLEIISNPGYGARLTVIIPVIEGSSTT